MDDCHLPSETAPELYLEAAGILTKAVGKRATLKTLIYTSQYQNIRKLFALVNECMKYKNILEEVTSHCSNAFMEENIIGNNLQMAIVLLYEYLLGHKFKREVSLRKMFQRHKSDIKSAVDKVVTSHKVKTLQEAAQIIGKGTTTQIPRYMRVNLIKSSVESVVDDLKYEGWDYVGMIDQNGYSETVMSFNESQFGLDPMLSDLLVFPVGTDLHDHHLTKTGVLVQQDRASCVPAHILNPKPGSVVLDCCSAPGNKTSHLASLLRDDGRVIALDRDYKRMLTMSKLLEKSGATCVELIHQDFLTVKPGSDDASYINFILVDPSCSGSGMLGSQMDKQNHRQDAQRLQTLKRFQITILKHALRFPNVERVVYSTCSIHQEENEEVAEEVMAQVLEYFQFRAVLPEWKNSRGISSFPHSKFFLRLTPEQDLTQGFFVACFERVKHKQQKLSDGETKENNQSDTQKITTQDTDMYVNDSVKSNSKSKRKALHHQAVDDDEEEEEEDTKPTATFKTEIKKKKKKRKQSTHSNITEFVDAEISLDGSTKSESPQAKQKSLDIGLPEDDSSSDDNVAAGTSHKMDSPSKLECKKRKHDQSVISFDDSYSLSCSKAKKRKKDKRSSLGKNGDDSCNGNETQGISSNTTGKVKKRKRHKHKSLGNLPDNEDLGIAAKAKHERGTLPNTETCNSPSSKVQRQKKVKPSPQDENGVSLYEGSKTQGFDKTSLQAKEKKQKIVRGSSMGKQEISSCDSVAAKGSISIPPRKKTKTKRDKNSDILTDNVHDTVLHNISLEKVSEKRKRKKKSKD